VPALLPRYVFSDHVATRLLKARHGDSSGIFGAARLWRPEELPAALAEAS
jgi:fructokinase